MPRPDDPPTERIRVHLERALDGTRDPRVRYEIREALQLLHTVLPDHETADHETAEDEE